MAEASPGSALATTAVPAMSLRIASIEDLQRFARLFAASGYFGQNPRDPNALMAECAIKILAGAEAGFSPFASATGVTVVKGRPGFGANLLAQAIKRHPLYDYRVLEKTDKSCRIKFLAGKEELGIETFTIQMAERAGLLAEREPGKGISPWRAFPEAMLFARCLTAGMRTHCPDALGGLAAYTPEELGAQGQIDQNGVEVVEVTEVKPTVTVEPAQVAAPAPQSPAAPSAPAMSVPDQIKAKARAVGLTAQGLAALLCQCGVPTLEALSPNIQAQVLNSALSNPATIQAWNAGVDSRTGAPLALFVPGPVAEPEPAAVLWGAGVTVDQAGQAQDLALVPAPNPEPDPESDPLDYDDSDAWGLGPDGAVST